MRKVNIVITLLAIAAILFETIRGNEPWEVQDQSKINQIERQYTVDTSSNVTSIIHFNKKEKNISRVIPRL